MVSVESGQRRERTKVRRPEGILKRRQVLADAAAGITPGEVDVSVEAARIERFRCVIYLCGAPHANIATPREQCMHYAETFGWEITDVIEERAGLLPPQGRDGLGQAVGRVKSGVAGAVLTACRSMISSVPREYDEVAREIEKAGGFLHVKALAPNEQGGGAVTRPERSSDCRARSLRDTTGRNDQGGDLRTSVADTETTAPAPWGLRRMAPLRNGSLSLWRYAGIDAATQTGRWIGEDGAMTPAELGKHGTSVNTYPPTQVGKDGKVDADSGHDATQD
ncbi:putative ATP-grasp target RiPP [Streptomyces aurantiacus]|uniref:putative ATP-grasp-modified RiPP n=1 Tax=Streptomyces aurantiacus TaxID=47760 RepID=UPI002793D766|nr:putative ATP-grasp-modified RiPP [Streptomyces aurantiacus]MDQ0775323.1 putative ATP-grasp target RiPP [Streptomyces aurantiacus]